MDRMDSRLANIERLLQGMSNGTDLLTSLKTPQTWTNTPLGHFTPEGDSSEQFTPSEVGLRAESAAAKNAVDRTVSRDAAVQQDTRLERALGSLRWIVDRVQQDVEERSTDAIRTKPGSQAVPAWKQVKPILERYTGMFRLSIPLNHSLKNCSSKAL